MPPQSTDYLIRALRTTAIAIVGAAIAYKLLDDLATRRVEQEGARQRAEWELAVAQGDTTRFRPRALDLFDGSGGAPAEAAVQPDGECQHGDWETRHPDPLSLVQEYVQRDGAGQFLTESAWRSSAVACPEQLAAADQATVVATFTSRLLSRGADTALVEVTYRREGLLAQQGSEAEDVSSPSFVAEPRVEVDTFVVVRDGETWRIHAPMLEQHVLPDAALRHFALPDADRAKIQAIR